MKSQVKRDRPSSWLPCHQHRPTKEHWKRIQKRETQPSWEWKDWKMVNHHSARGPRFRVKHKPKATRKHRQKRNTSEKGTKGNPIIQREKAKQVPPPTLIRELKKGLGHQRIPPQNLKKSSRHQKSLGAKSKARQEPQPREPPRARNQPPHQD